MNLNQVPGVKPAIRGKKFSGRDVEDELYMEIALRGDLKAAVLSEAKRLGRRPIHVVADVLERVFLEKLVQAVLDE